MATQAFTANGTFTAPGGVSRVRVIAEQTNASRLSAMNSSMIFAGLEENLWALGVDTNGQLGISNLAVPTSVPTQVVGTTRWAQAYQMGIGAFSSSYGIDVNGAAWSWGVNTQGQLGQGGVTTVSSPIQVVGKTRFQSLAMSTQGNAGAAFAFGIDLQGNGWAWGSNVDGVLGTNTAPATAATSSPVQLSGSNKFIKIWAGDINAGSVAFGLDTSGNLFGWGNNSSGILGTGNSPATLAFSSPVQVAGSHVWSSLIFNYVSNFTAVGCVFAIDTSGVLYAWGKGIKASDGTFVSTLGVATSSPVQVAGVGSTRFVSGLQLTYQSALFLDTAGNVWAIGVNTNGQLGVGDVTFRSSAVQIAGTTKFIALATSAGGNSVVGIDTSNNAWGWGINTGGQLGSGNITTVSSPVQVVGSKKFVSIYGDYISGATGNQGVFYGVDVDGSIWGWGINTNGQLGSGNFTTVSSPVQVVNCKGLNILAPQKVIVFDVTPGTTYNVGINQGYCTFNNQVIAFSCNKLTLEYQQ